jgi:hypothetical protein
MFRGQETSYSHALFARPMAVDIGGLRWKQFGLNRLIVVRPAPWPVPEPGWAWW